MARPVAVITGASSGIGAVFARKLAAAHDLVLIARRQDRLESLASELHAQYGVNAAVLVADLTREEDLSLVAERIAGERNLALLVNNAGIGMRGLFWSSDFEQHDQMQRLNMSAMMRLSHAALRNLVARNTGAIINVASVAAYFRRSGSVGYGASKAWVAAFTEGLHLDLRRIRSQVKVQALCPGFTYSEFHDAMGIDRRKLAGASMWLSADLVVDESLKALAEGTLFVVPGWRYRFIVALISKLPTRLRLAAELAGSGKL